MRLINWRINNMKTVMDAVNEFKGEWPANFGYKTNWHFVKGTKTIAYNNIVVCNKVQFEAAVEKSKYGVVCFDLMFHGCQTINASQAMEILKAIESGEITGVKWVGE